MQYDRGEGEQANDAAGGIVIRTPRVIAMMGILVPLFVTALAPATATQHESRVLEMDGLEQRTRQLLGQQSITSAVEAVTQMAGISGTSESETPNVAHRDPVRLLTEGVTRAGRIAQGAVRNPVSPQKAMWALREAERRLGGWQPGSPVPELPPELRSENVDLAALSAAALVVADSIDRALRLLTQNEPASRVAHASVVQGCDILDALPALCIGGSGRNEYVRDAAVQIDLGGDDVYLNHPGGADPFNGGAPVAVAIDMSGNDHYFPPSPARSGIWAAQGAGVTGGIGFLVDVEGNDYYERDVAAMGFGVLGVGLLADLSGNDQYRLDCRVGPFGTAQGGALGGGPGWGALIDSSGDDTYRAFATGKVEPGGHFVHPTDTYAFGFALAGAALHWDGGGNDTSEILARNLGTGITEFAAATGFGSAMFPGTVTAVLSGAGNTERRLRVETEGDATRQAISHGPFGTGILGNAVLSDAGGDDLYELTASTRSRNYNDGSSLYAFGTGIQGSGRLYDAQGNDRYVLGLAAMNEGPLDEWRRSNIGVFALGAAVRGSGVVEDSSGDDTYSATVWNERAVSADSFSAHVQGAGPGGALVDLGGSDSYTAVANPDGRPRYGLRWFPQGANGGLLNDVDANLPDSFFVSPGRASCYYTGQVLVSCDQFGGARILAP